MVLGGAHQSDNWNTQPDPDDSQFIWAGCHKLLPELEGVELIRVSTIIFFHADNFFLFLQYGLPLASSGWVQTIIKHIPLSTHSKQCTTFN